MGKDGRVDGTHEQSQVLKGVHVQSDIAFPE